RPESVADECRVRVECAGVCATDLALAQGYMGYEGVLGHEFVGTALEGPYAGRLVVGEINAGCGCCARCTAGDARHCETRSVLGILGRDGAFAEELRLPSRNLHPLPSQVSARSATFVEPLAAAFRIAEDLDLSCIDHALVQGDGRLGLLCAQVLAASGLQVDLLGRHPERASFLPDSIRVVNQGQLPASRRYELVVEATGDPSALQAALGRVRPRGYLVLKTTAARPAELNLAPLVVDEIRLIGSRCGPFQPAIDALAKGQIAVEPMIDACFPLSQGVQALEEAARPGVLKVLIEMNP
ncbi:MAG: threonine dehydrogenase-like Zn-dependent dehydrogenase, partial [Planctomycetota bacterium]